MGKGSFLHGLRIPSVAMWTFRAQEVTTAGSLSQIDKRNSEEKKASHLDVNGSYTGINNAQQILN